MDGFINLLKVPGMTSHDAVSYTRKLFPGTKVGHGGTLDPAAAGVLPLMLGKATRLSDWVMDGSKHYRAELQLGVTTDTDDTTGTVLSSSTLPQIDEHYLQQLFASLEGELSQVPPMYSAVKHQGKKMYQYAREGKEMERSQRSVTIYSLKLVTLFPPDRVIIDVHCSKGTYIRTLCRQVGEDLGCGGCMSFLLRKAVGQFQLKDAVSLDDMESSREKVIFPLDFLFQNEEKIFLESKELNALCQGQKIKADRLLEQGRQTISVSVDGNVSPVYTTKGEFVALARWEQIGDGEYSTLVLAPQRVFKPNQ